MLNTGPDCREKNGPRQPWRRVVAGWAAVIFLILGMTRVANALPIAAWTMGGLRADEIHGSVTPVPGPGGQAWLFDGLTGYVERPAGRVPRISNQFAVSAWIALGAYPLNWTPILDLHNPDACGLFFGIDAHGRLGLAVRDGGNWHPLTATNVIGLRQWHQVAGGLSPDGELRLYLDGRRVAAERLTAGFVPPANLDLLVGRHRFRQKPEGTLNPGSTEDMFCLIDGAVGGLKLFTGALSDDDVRQEYASAAVPGTSPLPPRVLPTGPPGPFGAFYTRLKFYPQWDAPWRTGDFPDVVVRFGGQPFQFVFWRGTSYVPNWVTENGIWYNNEFNETSGDVAGCGEPMSDKQTRYANVRIIESSEARCVVHWRYALTDVFYHIAGADAATGWGDWSDEVYTIYPDGTSVRDVTLHSSHLEQFHEWQESIVVMGPGFSPDNSLDAAGLTLVNAAGETATYSWRDAPPPVKLNWPPGPCIQLINTKSRFKPFAILRPQDHPVCNIFDGGVRREVAIYPWWNHWPAATYASDGRNALAADRPSHSSLTHLYWDAYEAGPQRMRKIMLAGLTDEPATNLVTLARSWSRPAGLTVTGGGFRSEGYDPAQKAYVLSAAPGTAGGAAEFTLAGSVASPVVNPAFVIKNWGVAEVRLTAGGGEIPPGESFRAGHCPTIDGENLVVWVKLKAMGPVEFSLKAR